MLKCEKKGILDHEIWYLISEHFLFDNHNPNLLPYNS